MTTEYLEDPKTINKEFAEDVDKGLSKENKELYAKYFYDDNGSEIFRQIMALKEYYPTDCEYEIFDTHKEELASLFSSGEPFNLVELGAGDGYKTKVLLKHFLNKKLDFSYVPLDISKAAVEQLVTSVKKELPALSVKGLVGEYMAGLEQLKATKRRNVVLFLGSSIGNFTLEDSRELLKNLRSALSPGDLVLTGFDLQKEESIMLDAYSDPFGITADFNINLLRRMNRELGANFDLHSFSHLASYQNGCMKSHLVSMWDQEITIEALDKTFTFKRGEKVHMEDSRKYTSEIIEELAADASFSVLKHFSDSREYFVDSLWEVQ